MISYEQRKKYQIGTILQGEKVKSAFYLKTSNKDWVKIDISSKHVYDEELGTNTSAWTCNYVTKDKIPQMLKSLIIEHKLLSVQSLQCSTCGRKNSLID